MNTQYPPLADVRNTLRIKWYRSPIAHERLRELSARSDKQGWMQTGGHVGLYLCLVLLSTTLWLQESWLTFIVCVWCTGFVATFYKGTAAHELGHGTVFKTKRLNGFFLKFVSLISWWDPYDYSTSHTYHHRYTTHIVADRENVLPLTPSLAPLLLLQLCTFNLFLKPNRNFNKGGFIWTVYLTIRSALSIPSSHTDIPIQEWMAKLHEDQPEAFRQSVNWSRFLLVFHGGVFVVAWVWGLWVLPLVITCPSFIANIGSYLLGSTQHGGLMQNSSDFRKNTRSITLNPVMSFLYWQMNWHIEHHMYAGVPCYNLKALAKELEGDMPPPKTLWAAWREMRKIWHKQQLDSSYVYDTPVPENKNTSRQTNDELVHSIGELAPAALRTNSQYS